MISTECAKCIHDEVCGLKTCVKEAETKANENRIGCIHPDVEVVIKCRKFKSGISYDYPDDRVATPEEFFNIMKKIHNSDKGYEESWHIDMDDLMCRVLIDLGYGDGVDIFNNTDKWYS